MIYVGMDLHQNTTTWFACDPDGKRVGSGKVDSSAEGWRSVLERLGPDAQVAIETGSVTWFCVEQLRLLGVEPTVVDARHFKLIAESRKKSDRRDARTLAAVLWRHPQELKQALDTLERVPAWMRPLLDAHYQVWLATQRQRAQLDQQIEHELEQWPDAQHLQTLPGVGPLVTLAIASALDDPRRFVRGRHVGSYAGLVPSVRNSGESTRHGSITHQGRSLLRHALTQAAHAALRGHALAARHRTWARGLDARRGRQVAVTALARRLLVIAHQMWLTGESYDPEHRSKPVPHAA